MKILNKFIWSKKEPSNKNDVWFDGSTWRMYTEEAWQSFTLPIDAADKVAKVLENVSEVYQEKLNAGYGIVIEGNTISVDDSAVWEAIETLQRNKVEQIQLNDYVPLDRYTSTSQVIMDNISELNSSKLNKTDVATINGQSLTEGGNIVVQSGASSTPDWNAKQGEVGFIKNRTHFMFRIENQIQTECIQESSNPAFNKYDEYGNLIELYIPFRNYRDDIPMGYFIKWIDEEVFVKHSYGEEKFTVKFYDYVYTFEPVYDESIDSYYCLKVSILDGYYDSSTEIQIADYDYLHPIPLGEFYIPDTIARTKDVTALEARIAALEAKLIAATATTE